MEREERRKKTKTDGEERRVGVWGRTAAITPIAMEFDFALMARIFAIQESTVHLSVPLIHKI
jgi:hypothetical protein